MELVTNSKCQSDYFIILSMKKEHYSEMNANETHKLYLKENYKCKQL